MKKRCERGFTLVELMIVMVIVGVLVAVAAPNMTKFLQKDRLRASTSDVTSMFYRARMMAVSTDSLKDGLMGIKFETDGRYYLLKDPKGSQSQFGAPHRLEPGVSVVSNTFNDGIVIFNYYGQLDRSCLPTGSMTAAVRLNDGSIDTTKVEVTFITGRIRETNR